MRELRPVCRFLVRLIVLLFRLCGDEAGLEWRLREPGVLVADLAAVLSYPVMLTRSLIKVVFLI